MDTIVLLYDETDLVRILNQLPAPLRVTFAAACAERLFPAYLAFSKRAGRGDPAALAKILERVWEDLLGDRMEVEQICVALARCMALIPGEDDEPWVDEQAYADDAASAVAYTLRVLETGDPQEAAWAARRAYDALGHHVINRLGVAATGRAMVHPLVQAELARQRQDLTELLGAEQACPEVISRIRARAEADARVFFASNSNGNLPPPVV